MRRGAIDANDAEPGGALISRPPRRHIEDVGNGHVESTAKLDQDLGRYPFLAVLVTKQLSRANARARRKDRNSQARLKSLLPHAGADMHINIIHQTGSNHKPCDYESKMRQFWRAAKLR
jgi:hypothetical protein